MSSAILKTFAVALAFGSVHALPQPQANSGSANGTPANNDALISELKTAPTVITRFRDLLTSNGQLLSGDSLAKVTTWDFNSNQVSVPGGQGGVVSASNIETFPVLTNTGLSMNFATLGPCGIFLPHVHPRANEFFIVVEGSVSFGYTLELGLLSPGTTTPEVTGQLTKNVGTLFPQGSVHYQINDSEDCKPATIFATLSSEDPGTTTVLQSPAGNGTSSGDVRSLLLQRLVDVIDSCLARCGTVEQ